MPPPPPPTPTQQSQSYSWIPGTIQDSSTPGNPVWLTKPIVAQDAVPSPAGNNNPWVPLRKVDCAALNAAVSAQNVAGSSTNGANNEAVYIEGGRATAFVNDDKIVYNFHRGPVRELRSALWFARPANFDNGDTSTAIKPNLLSVKLTPLQQQKLEPIFDSEESNAIEALYQSVLQACSERTSSISSFFEKITNSPTPSVAKVLNLQVVLRDESTVKLSRVGTQLSLRWHPKQPDSGGNVLSNLLTPPIRVLQRGYGDYAANTKESEEYEAQLGPVGHLIFVVHGVGEAMLSKADVKLPGLIEQMNVMRANLYKRQILKYKTDCDKIAKANKRDGTDTAIPPPPNRIEVIPIEWFHALHNDSAEIMKSLRNVTLPAIPAIRNIANDVIFDVLMYLTPHFCQSVLENVIEQIKSVTAKFCKIHPHFDGPYSIVGHSLGSVIVWDMLSLLQLDNDRAKEKHDSDDNDDEEELASERRGSVCYNDGQATGTPSHGHWGPNLLHTIKHKLPFEPHITVFLGSPLGMFLTLRGAHTAFEDERKKTNTTTSPFTLPTRCLYNIFHPSDPIAYRIEPLLMSPKTKHIPEAVFLTAPGQNLRLHLKAKHIGSEIQRSLRDTTATWTSLFTSAASAIENSGNTRISKGSCNEAGDSESDEKDYRFALGGSNQRIDYSLQPNVIDSEYLSAVMAHSTTTYFGNEELLQILVQL